MLTAIIIAGKHCSGNGQPGIRFYYNITQTDIVVGIIVIMISDFDHCSAISVLQTAI